MKQWFRRSGNQSGQALTEYGLIIALVAVVLAVVLVIFRDEIKDVFTGASNCLHSRGDGRSCK